LEKPVGLVDPTRDLETDALKYVWLHNIKTAVEIDPFMYYHSYRVFQLRHKANYYA
jgi:hypothetical protein